ncbi:hypothetical protein KOY49_01000 [Candidatus Minimicrobia vallesae]|uniref:Uncharacterized protein n=1 Tax=Candidatus Minimicrobia vallesae TaxID=2841264 RepID=A0A8F1MAK9_9BACT|nr:hypothetical protein [Candidatus Minimicrobia vallesae]QWQ31580.1 hypothetical protein KOY49_01000 [Candidatus Minimicrobia vallesae]
MEPLTMKLRNDDTLRLEEVTTTGKVPQNREILDIIKNGRIDWMVKIILKIQLV